MEHKWDYFWTPVFEYQIKSNKDYFKTINQYMLIVYAINFSLWYQSGVSDHF